MRRRAATAAVGLALGALLAGCGLPDDRDPRLITAEDAPLDLDEEAAGNASSSGDAVVTLFFVLDGVLTEVTRATSAEDLTTAIEALLDRPTADEESAGLRTEIPAETQLIDATVDESGVATIDLGCAPGEDPTITLPANCGVRGAEGTAQLTLFAQLVCTATRVEGVVGVVFLQDGAAQQAPIDGGLSPEPVRCTDYRSVRQPA